MASEPMRKRQIKIGTTGIVAICTAASRLLGFVRISLISFLFGAGGQADVLNLVFQIPNNLRRLLAEGALSSAFIPVLNNTLPTDLRAGEQARNFVRSLFGFQLLVFIPLLCLATLFGGQLTQLLFDFSSAEQITDATLMFRVLIWYILPISLNAVCMAILNTHNQFTIPALSPLASSIAVITTIIVLHASFGIYAVGLGILIGGIIQVGVHIPSLLHNRYRLLPTLNMRNSDLHRVLKKWVLIISSALLLFVNQQVAIYFASGLETGSGSAMIYALTFWQLPFGILGISVITVLYPQMSAAYAQGNLDTARHTFHRGARYLVHVLIPATIFLLCYSDDIVFFALQRGKFTLADTIRTAAVLRTYAVGLLGVALFQHGQRFYYAICKIRFTIIVLIAVVVIDIACSLWLKETPMRVSGLGLANSISFWVGAVILYTQRILRNDSKEKSNSKERWQRRTSYGSRLIACIAISSSIPIGYYVLFSITAQTLPYPVRLALMIFSACLYGALVLLLYAWFRIHPHPREFLLKQK